MINFPDGLHPSTVELVEGFATALDEKLRRSEIKYGWSDGWKDIDWQEKCLADFNHHISKGDPRDVAAYCAFMWFHGWQTRHTAQPNQLLRPLELTMVKTTRSNWSTWNWIEHLGGRFQDGNPGDYIEFGSVYAVAQMLKQYRRTVTAEVIAEISESLRQQGYEVKS